MRAHKIGAAAGWALVVFGIFGTVSVINAKHDQAMAAIRRQDQQLRSVNHGIRTTVAAVKQNTQEIVQVRRATEQVVQGAKDQSVFEAATVKQLRLEMKLPPAVRAKKSEADAHFSKAHKIIRQPAGDPVAGGG